MSASRGVDTSAISRCPRIRRVSSEMNSRREALHAGCLFFRMKIMSASPKTQIDKLISLPSISAMTYQVSGMISELERINDTEYPPQALQIRDVLQSIAEYVQSELWTILKQHKGKSSGRRFGASARERIFQVITSSIRISVPSCQPSASISARSSASGCATHGCAFSKKRMGSRAWCDRNGNTT